MATFDSNPKLLWRFSLSVGLVLVTTIVWLNFGTLPPLAGVQPAGLKDETSNTPKFEKKKKKGRAKSEERFVVPATDDANALMKFVRETDQRFSNKAVQDEAVVELAHSAIKQACEKILVIEKEGSSRSYRFARRRLLELAVHRLQEDSDSQVSQALIDEAEICFAFSERKKADARFAMEFCTLIEEHNGEEKAKVVYTTLGKMFADQKEADVARIGQMMIGIGRRLGILGEAIELKGTTLDGQSFDLASLRGKVVLIDFWTTWCGYCLEEFPNMKRCHLAYRSKGFEVVSVNCDQEREKLNAYLKLNHLPWVTLHNDEEGAHQPAAIHYGVNGYPTMFLLNREGKVVSTNARGRALRKQLKKLLGPPADITVAEGKFPLMNNEEMVDQLMDAAEELIESGRGKDLKTLREHIARKTWPLDLPAASTKPLTQQEIYQQTAGSVFIVGGLHRHDDSEEWEIAMGSAFAVTADGVLCTSCHVFHDDLNMQGMMAMDQRGRIYPIEEILAADPLTDTCFFRVKAKELRPLPLGIEAQPGQNARVLSHPGNMFYFFSTGHVSNYFLDDDGVSWMNVTADFGQGASGAPVLDECGNVIGQVSRTSTLFATGEEAVAIRTSRRSALESTKVARRPMMKAQNSHQEVVAVSEPQMVFKSCTPVMSIRKLVGKK